jgi:hypothetical protein
MDAGGGGARHSALSLPRQLALSARYALSDAVRVHCWPAVALRMWKAYVMASGVVSGDEARPGAGRVLRVGVNLSTHANATHT